MDLNGTQAAIRAGYKRLMPGADDPNFPTPAPTAAMNIKDPYIQGQGPALMAPRHRRRQPLHR